MPKIDRLPSGSYRMRVYLGKDASGKKVIKSITSSNKRDLRIMQRGGWSSDSVMKAVYRHTLADHEQTAVKATIDHFRQLVGD